MPSYFQNWDRLPGIKDESNLHWTDLVQGKERGSVSVQNKLTRNNQKSVGQETLLSRPEVTKIKWAGGQQTH